MWLALVCMDRCSSIGRTFRADAEVKSAVPEDPCSSFTKQTRVITLSTFTRASWSTRQHFLFACYLALRHAVINLRDDRSTRPPTCSASDPGCRYVLTIPTSTLDHFHSDFFFPASYIFNQQQPLVHPPLPLGELCVATALRILLCE